jgi:hypothetical protein
LCIWGALTWLALRFSLGVENAEKWNRCEISVNFKLWPSNPSSMVWTRM